MSEFIHKYRHTYRSADLQEFYKQDDKMILKRFAYNNRKHPYACGASGGFTNLWYRLNR